MNARRRGTLRWRLALGMTALALATAALVGLFGFLLGGWIGYDPEPVTVTRVEQVGDRVALVQITSENSTATADRARRDGVRWMLTAMAVSFVPAALLAWVVAGRVLKPVEQVADVVDRVDGSESGDRVDLAPRDDELGRLATGVDHMLDRLDARREEQRQLLHEVVPRATHSTRGSRRPTSSWLRATLQSTERRQRRWPRHVARSTVWGVRSTISPRMAVCRSTA